MNVLIELPDVVSDGEWFFYVLLILNKYVDDCLSGRKSCRTGLLRLKGGPQKGELLDRKFKIVRIGRFWRFQRDWTRTICGIL